jgi:hypothetical protein
MFQNSRVAFAVEDAWEALKRSYWLNVFSLLLLLLLWCGLVAYATRNQSIPLDQEGQVAYVRDYIWYWLIIVSVWMLNHGWYTLIFVFRNYAVRLRQYWLLSILGLLSLTFLYSFHFALGMLFNLVPLFNESYRAYLQGVTAQSQDERGGGLITSHQAERRYRRVRPPDDQGVLWGGVRIPTNHAVTNFVVIGTVGSGKTLTLQLLLQSLLHLEGGTHHESE